MVAERRFLTAASDRAMEGSAMETGQLVVFPGWDTLRSMAAEDVKRWILSQEQARNAHYLSVVASSTIPTHRGAGALSPQAPNPQAARAPGDQAPRDDPLEHHEVPPPHPGLQPMEINRKLKNTDSGL